MNSTGLMHARRAAKQKVIRKFLSEHEGKPASSFRHVHQLNRKDNPLLNLRQIVMACRDNTEIVYVSKTGEVHSAILRRVGQKRFSIVYKNRHYTTLYTFFLATGDCKGEFTDMGQITFITTGEKNNNTKSEN